MNIAIIGGGIGGLAAAVGLHKIGINAHVYEQARSFKPLGAGIGIGSNVMNSIDFTLLKKRFGEENITIQRADLHNALFSAVDSSYFHFNKHVEQFEQINDQVTLTFTDGTEEVVDYVIAADGINSMFRQSLLTSHTPRYTGYTCWRGISKNKGDVSLHVSSEAWSKKGRFGWAPLYNGDVYWFACVNANEHDEYYQSLSKSGVAKQFSHYSPLVERLIQETHDDYFLHHDIYDIKPLETFIYDRICLLGDAAHATSPNMGQGAGQSIEDAYELMNAIKNTSSVEKAFHLYDLKRVNKTKKVIKLSRQIGWAAQWDNPLLVGFRNKVFPYIPKSLLFWRLTFLFK